MLSRRFVRVRDGYIGGVAGGLAHRLGVSATLVRLLWLAAVLCFGTGLLIYAVMWWVVPHEERLPLEPTIWRRSGLNYHPPLQRTAVDRKFLGVCGGVARRWDLDPSLVRLVALSLLGMSAGVVLVAYLVAAAVLPGPDSDFVSRPVDL